MSVFHRIKGLLEYIFPSSSKTIHRKTDAIERRLEEIYTNLNELSLNQIEIKSEIVELSKRTEIGISSIGNCASTINMINERMVSDSDERATLNKSYETELLQIIELCNYSRQKLDTLLADFSNDTQIYYWSNNYEKQAIQNNYGNLTEEEDFKDKYFALIKGLDEESVFTVNRILWKQSQYLMSNAPKMNLFTLQEQNELRYVEDLFSKEVVKVSENVYAFGKYLLPVNHFESVIFYYKYCLSEVTELDKVRGKTIIDAGAYIGDTALLFSELEPSKIISFEPIPENAELCEQTILLNKLSNIVLERAALGAKKGIIGIYSAGEGSTFFPRKEDEPFYKEKVEVPVVTLDEYVDENNLEVGLIKMDIEGAEPDCLKGAMQVITKQRPILLICIYHNKNDFFGIKPMLESWGINYQYKIRKPTTNNATYDTLLIAEPK